MSITTSTNKLKVTELDFDDIKSALKLYLSGQDEFTDYNFEASGMSILLDILAYNTHYNAFYTNMLASEMFIDSATIRSNVVSRAKQLGYIPASKRGAEVEVDITITPDSLDAELITIPKNFKFGSSISGTTYIFTSAEAVSAIKLRNGASDYVANNVVIREGIALSLVQAASGKATELFTIPNPNVDTRSLVVTVNGEKYNFSDKYIEVDSNSKVYFLQEGDDELYQIYFGDGAVGKSLNPDDIVSIEYMISRIGLEGNGAKVFASAETIAGVSPTVALSTSTASASGGSSKESVSSIKLKAPRGFELQKRIVTEQDYKTHLVNDYPSIEAINVWGGQDADPVQFGTVYIALKIKEGYYISDTEKEKIKKEILQKKSMVTVTPVFLDPDYTYLVLDATVTFDQRATAKDSTQLKTDVTTTITGFTLTDLNKFENYFRHSNLVRKIDDTNVAIKNSTLGVKLRKEFTPTLNSSLNYTFNFFNELYHPHVGHMSILSSTKFNHSGYADCYLEDGDGIIKVYRKDDNGVTKVVNDAAGTINYSTGKVFLDNFLPTGISIETTKLSITVTPKNLDILPKQNSIISILDTDLTITMKDDTLIIGSSSANY